MFSRLTILSIIILITFNVESQNSAKKEFKKLSCAEKWWVIWHPFVAKKAYKITIMTRDTVEMVKKQHLLIGNGDGLQVDAFRHAYWMAILSHQIGGRRARSLGKAHEKGNHQDYKKHKNEEGNLPDKVSSEMDLYNNEVGIDIGKKQLLNDFTNQIITAIKRGACKIVKQDKSGNYLDKYGNIILNIDWQGKWENHRCLVFSNEIE